MTTKRKDCAHFIPVLTSDLVELLASDRSVSVDEGAQLRQIAHLVQKTYHGHCHGKLRELMDAYAPFDPDSDAATLIRVSAADRQTRLNDLLSDLVWVLDRAQFRHLDRHEIGVALSGSSEWGIRMRVDFSLFDHIAIFVRGEAYQRRTLCDWTTLFQPREIDVPIFRRLVMILKFRSNTKLGPGVNPEHVYLKIFKDLPRADVDMLVPGARVRLKLIDRGKIGVGLLTGVGTALWKARGLFQLSEPGTSTAEVVTEWALFLAYMGAIGGLVGYLSKSYFDYQNTHQAYHLNLTQSLYFQNLDGNAGVLTRLFDEAEEQQTRTTVLAYFCLWKYAGPKGMTSEELEATMGVYLDRYAEITLLCEPGSPIETLKEIGLVESAEGRFRARSPTFVIKQLRHQESGLDAGKPNLTQPA